MKTAYKTCTRCGKTLPLSEFYFHKTGKEAGRPLSACKSCTKDRAKTDALRFADRVASTRKKYKELNKEKIKASQRAHYVKNRTTILEKKQAQRDADPDSAEKQRIKDQKRYYSSVPFNSAVSKNLAKYDDTRSDVEGFLEVKCTYCGVWYRPTHGQVKARLDAINGYMSEGSEARLYCSSACKDACPIYKRSWFVGESLNNTSREVQPHLRQMVLERDGYTCQKCGAGVDAELHCHHIDPVVSNPVESADTDNCITVCKQCHKELHRLPGCSTGELRCSTAVGF